MSPDRSRRYGRYVGLGFMCQIRDEAAQANPVNGPIELGSASRTIPCELRPVRAVTAWFVSWEGAQ